MVNAPSTTRAVRAARWRRRVRVLVARYPLDLALTVFVTLASAIAIVWPFAVATYPPMTDLPFHAAQTSAFRHYFDPSFHFSEQFELTPLRVPYLSSYVLGALFMLVLAPVTAVKAATLTMLALLPVGLATLFWGMRKSPLLAIAALPVVWTDLTHWGFVNFVAAIGLYAAALGVTLRLIRAPSRRLSLVLAGLLLLVLFTHVFRYPLAIAGVVGTTLVLYPSTKTWRPVVLPLVPSLLAFLAFRAVAPPALSGALGPLSFDFNRLDAMRTFVVHGFDDPREWEAFRVWGYVLAGYALVAVPWSIRSWWRSDSSERRWAALVTIVPLGSALAFLCLYLVLPMEIGLWWYVYPREAVSTLALGLGLLPSLPRHPVAKVASLLAMGLAALGVTRVVAHHYAAFDEVTRDFTRIIEKIPQGPKLMYLVFDHEGTRRTNTPFIHLPAYVQAMRGGWLSFHFAVWDASPLRFRSKDEPGAVVPPPVPLRWEWTPDRFDVRENGRFFDWFLVRRRDDPTALFAADPSVHFVAHDGTWWLYRRADERPTINRP